MGVVWVRWSVIVLGQGFKKRLAIQQTLLYFDRNVPHQIGVVVVVVAAAVVA